MKLQPPISPSPGKPPREAPLLDPEHPHQTAQHSLTGLPATIAEGRAETPGGAVTPCVGLAPQKAPGPSPPLRSNTSFIKNNKFSILCCNSHGGREIRIAHLISQAEALNADAILIQEAKLTRLEASFLRFKN